MHSLKVVITNPFGRSLFLGGEVLIDLIAQHIPITAQDAAIIFTYAIGTMAIRALMKLLAIADIKRN
jgi:hypothetical protein